MAHHHMDQPAHPDTTPGAREDYYFESTNGGTTWFGWWLTSGMETPTVRHTASYTFAAGDSSPDNS